MKKNEVIVAEPIVPEVVDQQDGKVKTYEPWKDDNFTPDLITIKLPKKSLDPAGRINYFHHLTMEAGKVSIAAALMTGLELYRIRAERRGNYKEWVESNLPFSYKTANRYTDALESTLGTGNLLYDLAHDTEVRQLGVVYKYTNRTEYKSLYQLYYGEGIVKKSKLGGSRVKEAEANGKKVGRKRKEDLEASLKQQEEELGAESIRQRVADLYTAAVIQGGLGNCKSKDLENICGMLKNILRESDEILKSRKAK